MNYPAKILALATFLMLLQLLDIGTTYMLLSLGGAEANPIANPNSIMQLLIKITLPMILGLIAISPDLLENYKILTRFVSEQPFTDKIKFEKAMQWIFKTLIIIYIGVVANNTIWIIIATGAR